MERAIMETYEITREDVERKEAGPFGCYEQFWVDVFRKTLETEQCQA